MKTLKDKRLDQSTSKIIKLDLAPISNKLKMLLKLSLFMIREIILYIQLHLMSLIVGMPKPSFNQQPYMQAWAN